MFDHVDRCRLKRLKTLILPGSLSLKDDLKIKAKVSSDACEWGVCRMNAASSVLSVNCFGFVCFGLPHVFKHHLNNDVDRVYLFQGDTTVNSGERKAAVPADQSSRSSREVSRQTSDHSS